MNLAAINEETEKVNDVEIKKPTSCLPSLKNLYTSAFTQLEANNFKQCEESFLILIDLIKEKESDNVNLTRFDLATLKRIKFACYKQLSLIYSQTNRIKERIDALIEATTIDPDDISSWYDLAMSSYTDFNLYLSMEAFTKVLEINSNHSQSLKYLIILHLVIFNFDEILELLKMFSARNFCKVTAIVLTSTLLSMSLPAKFIKRLLILKKQNYRCNLNPSYKNLHIWFLEELDKWNSYFNKIQCNLYSFPPIANIHAGGDISCFTQLIEKMIFSLNEFLTEYNCEKLTFINLSTEIIEKYSPIEIVNRQNNINSLEICQSNVDNIGSIKTRSDRTQNSANSQSFVKSVESILSKLNIFVCLDSIEDTLPIILPEPKPEILKNTENVNQIEFQIINKFNDFIKSTPSYLFIDLAKYLIILIIKDYPYCSWNIDLCSFFINICTALFLHHNMPVSESDPYDCSIIIAQIYLRYLEIYVFFIKFSSKNSEKFVYFQKCINLCIDQLTGFQLLPHYTEDTKNTHLRIFWCLAHFHRNDNINISLSYLNSCLNITLDSDIVLFSIADLHNTHGVISNDNIKKLMGDLKNLSKINKSSLLFRNCDFKNILKIYSKYFYKNESRLFALPRSELIEYLKTVLLAFVYLSKIDLYLLEVLHILKLLFNREVVPSFHDLIENQLILVLDKIFINLYEIEPHLISQIFNIALKALNSSSLSENHVMYIKLWSYVDRVIESWIDDSTIVLESKNQIYTEYVELFHSNLIRKKLCCTEIARPLIHRIVKKIIEKINNTDKESQDKELLKIYLEALLFCLVGYPSFKKVSQNIDFLKDHPSGSCEKSMTSDNIIYYETAYSYLKPNHSCNFSIIIEGLLSENKKQISTEMLKFYTMYANFTIGIIKDSNGKNMLDSIHNYENCVHGINSWPLNLISRSNIYLNNSAWNRACDFSIFHYLFENCLKSTTLSFTSLLNWLILSIIARPFSYLSWWAVGSYCILRIEDDIKNLKNQQLPNSSYTLLNIVSSAFYAYKNCLKLIDNDNIDKCSILSDYGWLCYRIASLGRNDFKLDSSFFIPEKLTKISLKCYITVINDLKLQNKTETLKKYEWFYIIYIKKNYIHLKSSINESLQNICHNLENIFHQSNQDFSKLNGITEMVYELCNFIWEQKENSLVLDTTVASCNKFSTSLDSQICSTKSNEIPLSTVLETIEQHIPEELESIPLSQIDESQPTTPIPDLILPKDNIIFDPYPWRQTAFISICHCLQLKPYNYKYIIKLANYLNDLSKNHPNEYFNSFNKLIISVFTGKNAIPQNSSFSILTNSLLLLYKKPNHSENRFIGLFTLSNRANIFRKSWKLNCRMLEGFLTFQKYMNKGLKLMCAVLDQLDEVYNLAQICVQLSKERSNTYLIEENKCEIIEESKLKIMEKLHKMCEDDTNNDTLLIICYKLLKMPTKFLKLTKETLHKIILDKFPKISAYSPISHPDNKSIIDAAMKYANDLDSKKV